MKDSTVKHFNNLSLSTGIPRRDASESFLQDRYLNKLSCRCKELISRGINKCGKMFVTAFEDCYSAARAHFDHSVCWPLNTQSACDLKRFLNGSELCDAIDQVDLNFTF